MNKVIILIISFLISSNILALTPYQGSYDLYADTKMGNLNIGTAVLTLKINNNQFEFNTEAKTESLWKALYDYSRLETSSATSLIVAPSPAGRTMLIPRDAGSRTDRPRGE